MNHSFGNLPSSPKANLVDSSYGSPKKITSELFSSDVIFLSKPTKEAWYGIRRLRRHGITSKTWMSSRVSVYLRRLDSIRDCVAIPYRNELRIPSTAETVIEMRKPPEYVAGSRYHRIFEYNQYAPRSKHLAVRRQTVLLKL